MDYEISTSIEIHAPAERVWSILLDFAAYPDWNPFVREICGGAQVGERLRVRLARTPTASVTFHPRVTRLEPLRELSWRGRLGLPRLFDGDHSFTLAPRPDGSVRFTQAERFRGLLVPLVWRRLAPNTRTQFERMNAALGARAEATADRPDRR